MADTMSMLSDGNLGDLIRLTRKTAGLTQTELVEWAGLSPYGLNGLVRGACSATRCEMAQLLADALGLAGEEGTALHGPSRGVRPASSTRNRAMGARGRLGWSDCRQPPMMRRKRLINSTCVSRCSGDTGLTI
jgi:hypothetical protein